jgi:hypothetical protein
VVSTSSTDEGGGWTDQGAASTDEGGAAAGEGGGAAGEGGAAAGEAVTMPPERPGRYQRSPAGMVGALVVTVLVILAFVGFRALNRSDLDVKPERVDYLSQVRFAQQDGQVADLAYPARLPDGWYATNVSFSSGDAPEIELSMLTADDQYVGFVQSRSSASDLLTTYVDPHPQAGSPVRITGSVAHHWDTWTDTGGDTGLVAEHGQDALLVFGTVSKDQLAQLAASLTMAKVSRDSR